MKMKSNNIAILIIVAGIAAGAGYLWGSIDTQSTSNGSSGTGEKKIAYWVAPMDPNYRRDEPGKSPMGMDLIPVYEGDEQEASGIEISSVTLNNIGVRLGEVRRQSIAREIKTVGYVSYDETKVSHVHMRAEGWIDELVTKVEGARVAKGDLLFRIYSPDIVVAQSDYLQALRGGNKELIALADERLQLLGLEARQVRALAKSRRVSQLVEVYAAQDGVIAELNVAEKMFVTPGTSILSIADLSTVWVLADIFEAQIGYLRKGLSASVKDSHDSGLQLEGDLEYVYPMIDPKTRSGKVRLRFTNPDEVLKPNMFADVIVRAEPIEDALVIPTDGLIRTGSSTRVVAALGDGRFEPREVKIGVVTDDLVQVLGGLEEGEEIVVSGQFLIDSESSLSSGFRRMTEGDEANEEGASLGAAPNENQASIFSIGIIHHVMPDQSKINLTHEPIPEIGWPTMTMDFGVVGDVDLESLSDGDTIHFEIGRGADGMYVITAIHKMDHSEMEAE